MKIRILSILALVVGCSSPDPSRTSLVAPGTDAGQDLGSDAFTDTGLSDAADVAPDAALDTTDPPSDTSTDGDAEPVKDARDVELDSATDADPPEDAGEDAGEDPGVDAPDLDLPDAPAPEELRVDLRDIWGRRLQDGECVIRVGGTTTRTDDGIATFVFEDGDSATVVCEADDFHTADVSVWHDGDIGAERDDPDAQFGLAYYAGARTLFVGLPHLWFASTGRAPSDGNLLRLMRDGEDTWQTVAERIDAATESIHAASWWWESDFELIRPLDILSESLRRQYQVIELLEESPATKRVLIWGHPLASFLNVDEELVGHGEVPRDDFEFMTQENPTRGSFSWSLRAPDFGDALASRISVAPSLLDDTPLAELGPAFTVDLTDFPFGFDAPLASYHQKLWVFDGDEAVVSGMNVKLTDWDGSDHEIFDHRRMEFGASASARRDVRDRESEADSGPRKDYAIYIQGPLVTDVEDLFASRWNLLIDEGAEYSWNASEIRPRVLPERAGGIEAQLVTTMPEPFNEYSALESHLNAVRNATDYIFIEDQYWRAPVLVDAIVERMSEVRDLVLIVVTKPVSEFTDPGCYWTHATDEALEDAFGDRYRTYRLQAFATAPGFGFDETDGVFVDMDIHSKLMIVDDVFLSVGSCNKNNRGYVYEGEANVSVLDEDWVTEARVDIIGNILGVSFTPSDWIAELDRAAARNDSVWEAWDDEGFDLDLDGDPLPFAYDPRGFIYSLEFAAPSDCLIEPIGPDVASSEDDESP